MRWRRHMKNILTLADGCIKICQNVYRTKIICIDKSVFIRKKLMNFHIYEFMYNHSLPDKWKWYDPYTAVYENSIKKITQLISRLIDLAYLIWLIWLSNFQNWFYGKLFFIVYLVMRTHSFGKIAAEKENKYYYL